MTSPQAISSPSARIALDDVETLRSLAGPHNENLKALERRLCVRIGSRGAELFVSGAPETVAAAGRVIEQLIGVIEGGYPVAPEDVEQAVSVATHQNADVRELFLKPVLVRGARQFAPKSLNQKRYVDAIRANDIVFGIGPAGTGKTYLAVAMAVAYLQERRVKRIILARPAVEAGERLGFLPGDLAEKVNPYLRPLYDALDDMVGRDRATTLVEEGTVEVAPLAFMRGRTLNDAFAILDEAQNATVEQMKMFLTRLGPRSKAVVTGDVTQVDLPVGKASGLSHARQVLAGIEGIAINEFASVDVVRHPLVQQVIEAYARSPSEPEEAAAATAEPAST